MMSDQAYDSRDQDPRRAFMLRVAGLPIETVHALRCPASRRWADSVLTEDERLRAAGSASVICCTTWSAGPVTARTPGPTRPPTGARC